MRFKLSYEAIILSSQRIMNYSKPIKRIVSNHDLEVWKQSDVFDYVVQFVSDLQELILGLENDAPVTTSKVLESLLKLLDEVEKVIERNPVVHDKDVSRFGKVEFRDFYDEIGRTSEMLLEELVSGLDSDPRIELLAYFNESWGDRTRIDYGSGHELNFITFLLCLRKLGLIVEQDFPCLVLKVFNKYIQVMRSLQKLYWLEPAGSHGVWGLDDYHFLPFLFGASQLATHPFMRPKLIHNEELVEDLHKKYMYFECIYFINSVKVNTGPNKQKLSLRWHSPMLDDILSAKSWMKIKEGMLKMYKAEVLGKLPVMQHFMFGSIIPCPEGIDEHSEANEEDCCHGHAHVNTWGDCCGIKIPSAIAASEMNKKATGAKPLPFD